MRPPPAGQSIFMRINSMWGEGELDMWRRGWGGVGTHPLFAYNFHRDVTCWKRYIFGFYPEKGIYFWEF